MSVKKINPKGSIPQKVPAEEKTQDDAALESLSLLKATLESTADGILVVNAAGVIMSYNQKFRNMWGIPQDVLAGLEDNRAVSYVLNSLKEPQLFIEKLNFLYQNPEADCFDEIELQDGRIFERYSIPQRMGDKIVGRVFSFRDVTERKSMEEKLLYQATHDSLTGLPNRTLLYDRIEEGIKNARRHHYKLAVALFDLNRFKSINDSLGHEFGDILLEIVAKRMRRILRETDTLARLGGDEFVLVIAELTHKEEVFPIIERCLAIFNEAFEIQEHHVSASASMGVSFFPDHGKTSQELLKYADSAMYHSKNEGGHNGYKVYGSYMTDKALETLSLESDLNNALQLQQFSLFYQPILDLKTGVLQGAEALIRWIHPEKGIIGPDKFIPLAEETGLIIPMGSWVLKEVGRQMKAWKSLDIFPFFISFNVSVQQLKEKNFLQEVENMIDENQLDPRFLQMEITETGLMSNASLVLETLKNIEKKGVLIVIDDFGTGYSNLNYLNLLSVDKLKIDKSFIQDTSGKGHNIVLSILALAKKLKMGVVAEGVETKEQLEFLRKNHCEEVQGYYFSKPVESHHFVTFAQENKVLSGTYSNSNKVI